MYEYTYIRRRWQDGGCPVGPTTGVRDYWSYISGLYGSIRSSAARNYIDVIHIIHTKSFAVNRSLDLQVIRGQARLLEKYMFLPSIFCLQQLCLATDSSLEWSSSGACKPRLQLGFGPYSEESFFLQRATLPTKQPSEPWTSPPWQSATSRGLAALWENKGLSKLSTHLLVYTSGKTRCVYLIEKKVFPSFYWN